MHLMRRVILMVIVLAASAGSAQAQARIDRNVVYGMYSGLALLLDVHYPERPNGYGIVCVPGSAWTAPLGYDAQALKESDEFDDWAKTLLASGYTLFFVNHRATPRFVYPAAVEDVQRAVVATIGDCGHAPALNTPGPNPGGRSVFCTKGSATPSR